MSLFEYTSLSLLAGAALGWAYFHSLWATVQRLPGHRRPAMLMALSLLLRLGTVLAAFTVVVRWGDWPALLSALAGFVVARVLLVRRTRSPAPRPEHQP